MATKKKDVTEILENGDATEMSYADQAKEILRIAREKGVEHSFMFTTTFNRYVEQIQHLSELQKIIKDNGMLVKKEYVKGRENIYMNPAINAYNATCAGADRTAQLIFRCILQPLSDGDEKDAFDMF